MYNKKLSHREYSAIKYTVMITMSTVRKIGQIPSEIKFTINFHNCMTVAHRILQANTKFL